MILKRLFDILSSFFGLIFFSPLLVLISIVIFFFNGKPILFRQLRPGLNCAPFTFIKFRTMKNKIKKNTTYNTDENRITKLGMFLRKTSLDELPSLWNVLVGNMSLVGPRPLLEEYLDLYDEHQNRRHNVKPGITGWAQINGRNNISWNEKFDLDVWYTMNRSFFLDLKILFITFYKVIFIKDISHSDHTTMPKFKKH